MGYKSKYDFSQEQIEKKAYAITQMYRYSKDNRYLDPQHCWQKAIRDLIKEADEREQSV